MAPGNNGNTNNTQEKNYSSVKQLPKIKALLKKYRYVKNMQSNLLKLSELASKTTDMQLFYPALSSIIKSIFSTDNFFILLSNQQQELTLAYNHNINSDDKLYNLTHQDWLNSLAGQVFINKQPIHTNANQQTLADQLILNNRQCVDWLGVPLKRQHQIIGVLAIQQYREQQYFNERDCELLQFIGEHLITAIDRVQSRELLEQSIQQRTKKLQETNTKLQQEILERQKAENLQKALLSISEYTACSHNLSSFYQKFHDELNQLINANNCYIALLSDDQQQLNFPFYVDEKITPITSRIIEQGLTELVINIAKPILIQKEQMLVLQNNGQTSTQPFNQIHHRPQMPIPQAYLAAPLIIDGKTIGVIAVQHYQNSQIYQKSDLELLRFMSQHIAIAIARKAEQTRRQHNSEELERLVTERTQALQASNFNLRMQIEERRKAEARLYHEAHHDTLTKLPNRAMLMDRLSYALRHLKRHPNHKSAVLFIDLDRFKMINDTIGHHAGDLFLIEIAKRLKQCIRDNDILARLGGDEFVILLDAFQSQDDIEEIATRITLEVEKPFDLDGNIVYSSASIGIANCHNQYKNADEIIRDADSAMYQAKSLGRGRYIFFDSSMREQLLASMTLEQELRIAVKQQQFELHYQSILDLTKTTIIGFEALLRWNHPKRGVLTPTQFLTMAEETGMILDIENWVLKQVCTQLTEWQHNTLYNNAFISLNLSGRHLNQTHQLNDLIRLIHQYTDTPERLIIEFDELAFSQQPEQSLKSLRKLKKTGVRLALDDYGAGMSSMNLLHDYPFEFIKLDRSFVNSLNTSDKNLSLIKALSSLGEQFGYRLVAEGIENQATLAKVQAAGCEFGQGYFINHPEKMENPEVTNDKDSKQSA